MLIDRFLSTGSEFLGCKHPIMCGAMTWISDPKLVSAVGNYGGFGLLAGGNAPVEVLKNQILETREMTAHPCTQDDDRSSGFRNILHIRIPLKALDKH